MSRVAVLFCFSTLVHAKNSLSRREIEHGELAMQFASLRIIRPRSLDRIIEAPDRDHPAVLLDLHLIATAGAELDTAIPRGARLTPRRVARIP